MGLFSNPNADQLMRFGSIPRALFTLGFPSMIAMIVSAVYNFVDTFFIGLLHNDASMGAVSISMPIFIILGALGAMIGVGSSSLIARHLGAKESEDANYTATMAIVSFVVLSVFVSIFVLLNMDKMLHLLGATDAMMRPAHDYIRVLVLGSVFTIGAQVLTSIVRSEGASFVSMISLLIGAAINIVLDPIFIFTLDMGIEGAAIATVIAQSVTFIYLLRFFWNEKGVLRLHVRYLKRSAPEHRKVLWEIMTVGMPIFVLQILFSISSTLLYRFTSVYGESAVAAIGIASRIYQLPVFLFMGFIQGFQPFASFNYGAKQFQRVKDALRFCTVVCFGSAVVIAIVMYSQAHYFVGMFTSSSDVIPLATSHLRICMMTFPFVTFVWIYSILFQALGKSRMALILSLSRQGLIYIPILWFVPPLFASNPTLYAFTKPLFQTEIPPALAGISISQSLSDVCAITVTLV
ncbi:MAG: MATE family efflux transporter, partial [Bacilli bacterium]